MGGSRSVVCFIEADAVTSAALALYKSPAGGFTRLFVVGVSYLKSETKFEQYCSNLTPLAFPQSVFSSLSISLHAKFKLLLPTNVTAPL